MTTAEQITLEIEQKIAKQQARFEQELPRLAETHNNRWVVYLDGQVLHSTDTQGAALAWAVQNTSPNSGALVAQVAHQDPVLLSAAFAYRAKS
jgi:uridylate kinase